MRPLNRRSFVILTTAIFAAGLTRPLAAGTSRVSTDRTGRAIQGYDTLAYWTVNAAQDGSDDHTVTWNGAVWRFAKQDDADQFASAPESFAPQFGGFCARAMSLGKVVDGDPEVWRIFEGRLYLFARPAGGKVFDKGEAEIIVKAEQFWQTLY